MTSKEIEDMFLEMLENADSALCKKLNSLKSHSIVPTKNGFKLTYWQEMFNGKERNTIKRISLILGIN